MRRGGRHRVIACLVMLGCAAGVSSVPARSAPSSPALAIVTFGDSVPRGTNCHCTPYPQLVADRLSTSRGRKVIALNDSVAGYTTANVFRQITTSHAAIADTRRADAVEIEIGANDVPHTPACGNTVGCYAPRVVDMRARLAAIVERIRALTSGRRVDIVLLDYWSIWLGGRYASARGPSYVAAANAMTRRVNAAIRSIADETGAGYVDVRAAFKGPSYAYDETHYLAADGDHPNASGHRRIAAAAEIAIRRALHI